MNKFFPASLIILDVVTLSALPLQAQSIDTESTECRNAIASVESQLETDNPLEIKFSEMEKLEYYPDHPEGRPNGYGMGMQGDGALSVIGSPVLLSSLSTKIVNSCNSISLLEFGVYQTGNVRTFGLMSDGEVREFQCPSDYDDYPIMGSDGQLQFYPRDLTWGESCPL